MPPDAANHTPDEDNAAFWHELCGTSLARTVGIQTDAPDELRRFDNAYLALYPYLVEHVDRLDPEGKKLLEIGLGYGTLGQHLLERGADYHGIDVAAGPVRMMRHRAALAGRAAQVEQASVLAIPWPDGTFDRVISIGCLHHTGDLPRSVNEVRRVLRPGGKVLVMVYNRHSFRRLAARISLRDRRRTSDPLWAMYDANEAGRPAPHTDFVSRRQVRRLFASFANVKIASHNFDDLHVPGIGVLRRDRLLGSLGRVAGLDLYVEAENPV